MKRILIAFFIWLCLTLLVVAVFGQAVRPSLGFGFGYLDKTEKFTTQIKGAAEIGWLNVDASFAFGRYTPMQGIVKAGYVVGRYSQFQIVPSIGYAWFVHGQQKREKNYGQITGGIEVSTQINNGIIYAEWAGSFFGVGMGCAFFERD